MNDPTKHTGKDDDELPELAHAVDRHFYRAKVIVSAIAVAVTVGLALASLVDRIQRDIGNHRSSEHASIQHDLGELAARIQGNEQMLLERGIRITNLEQQVYEIKTKPSSRPDPFTGTMGRALEKRIIELEYQQADPEMKQKEQNQ